MSDLLILVTKEFDYAGINKLRQCFHFTRNCDDFIANLYAFDDGIYSGVRQYSDESLSAEYLVTTISQLLSLILDPRDVWENVAAHHSHDALSQSQLRRLLLNAPISFRESLRTHPQYDATLRHIHSYLDAEKARHKEELELSRHIDDIRKITQIDPYRAYSEAYALSSVYPKHRGVETLLRYAMKTKQEWTKILDDAKRQGMNETKKRSSPELYERIAKSMHWTETQSGSNVVKFVEKQYLDVSRSHLDVKVFRKRLDALSKRYPDYGTDTLEAVILYCSENDEMIDLSLDLSEQFDIT